MACTDCRNGALLATVEDQDDPCQATSVLFRPSYSLQRAVRRLPSFVWKLVLTAKAGRFLIQSKNHH